MGIFSQRTVNENVNSSLSAVSHSMAHWVTSERVSEISYSILKCAVRVSPSLIVQPVSALVSPPGAAASLLRQYHLLVSSRSRNAHKLGGAVDAQRQGWNTTIPHYLILIPLIPLITSATPVSHFNLTKRGWLSTWALRWRQINCGLLFLRKFTVIAGIRHLREFCAMLVRCLCATQPHTSY